MAEDSNKVAVSSMPQSVLRTDRPLSAGTRGAPAYALLGQSSGFVRLASSSARSRSNVWWRASSRCGTFADGDELLVAPDIFVIDVIIHCVFQWLGSVVREVHYWWSCAGTQASLLAREGNARQRRCPTRRPSMICNQIASWPFCRNHRPCPLGFRWLRDPAVLPLRNGRHLWNNSRSH